MLILLLFRALHVRLMLYRPSFCRFCVDGATKVSQAGREASTGQTGRQDVGSILELHCALSCFYTASELIKLLHKAIPEDLFGAWWFALYCEITATAVHYQTKADI